jgi:hypothetical protein
MYTVFPCMSVRGCFQDLNPWPHGHKATTLPLRIWILIWQNIHFAMKEKCISNLLCNSLISNSAWIATHKEATPQPGHVCVNPGGYVLLHLPKLVLKMVQQWEDSNREQHMAFQLLKRTIKFVFVLGLKSDNSMVNEYVCTKKRGWSDIMRQCINNTSACSKQAVIFLPITQKPAAKVLALDRWSNEPQSLIHLLHYFYWENRGGKHLSCEPCQYSTIQYQFYKSFSFLVNQS